MNKNEKDFLVALLNLSEKIKTGDDTITEDISLINSYNSDIPEGIVRTEEVVNSAIDNLHEKIDTVDNEKLIATITSINHINSSYIANLIRIRSVKDKDEMVALLDSLLEQDICFSDSLREYNYYSLIVSYAISTSNSSITKKAIDRIQLLA
ncbi:MAG: hypothetical protein N3I35_18290 [Clostridia bacterium]|nr:hypothetical protein [Clostridia bacterium]